MAGLKQLGLLNLNPSSLVRELRQDMKDDWFPDCLLHEDRLEEEFLVEAIEKNLANNGGQFQPTPRSTHDIPKMRFILRCSLESQIVDRAYYHALCIALQRVFDPLLANCVLSHRMNVGGHGVGRYIFKHPIEQWRQFEGFVRDEAGSDKTVLITDISNFYENIQLGTLNEVLLDGLARSKAGHAELAVTRDLVAELQRCLGQWAFDTSKGLPQNRDASSILANAYLRPIDEAMASASYRYYRYMDDIRIVVNNRYQARSALQALIRVLRKLGLNVNGAKTEIVEPGDPGRAVRLGVPDKQLAAIDQMWKSRSEQVIRRSLTDLKRFALRLIKEGLTQERSFRFAMKRFENLALCPDLDLGAEYFAEVIQAALHELDEQPYSSDQLARLLKASPVRPADLDFIVGFLADKTRSIYDWQNYLLWQVLVYHGHYSDEALELARHKLMEPCGLGCRAGPTLLLGAAGRSTDRDQVLVQFKGFSSPLEVRAGLIAVHDVAFHDGVNQQVKPYIQPHDEGVYRRLHQKFAGRYHKKLDPVPFAHIYDEVSQYD